MKKVELNKNWKFKIIPSEPCINKYADMEKWRDASVPGTIHTDLLTSELIEAPFYEDNEIKLQWVNECDWEYTTSFNYPVEFKEQLPVNLILEGLDTFADLYLNDIPIGKCDNMFRSYSFDVTSMVKHLDNRLRIRFHSAVRHSKMLEEKHGKLYVEVNTERVYARKAQYSFGWDWGPSFPTVGIYKPVYLQQKNQACIKSIKFNTIEILRTKAIVEADVDVEGSITSNMYMDVNILFGDKLIKGSVVRNISENNRVTLEIEDPLLWWPCCLGDQPLYKLNVSLNDKKNQVLNKQSRKVGIRIIKLLLMKDDQHTFKFLINDKEIFIKGVNWIPADSFLPRVSELKYKKLLLLAKKANCNMIRVWGGGTYEQNIFYELCDEYGLLVWQDFMFACGSYPVYDEFLENVKVEIEQNVERLQYHPSISIWCGNNECEWLWYQKQDHDVSKLPGYNIYHKLIPTLLKKIDSLRPYWPSTPYGYDEDPNDQNSGNTHQWNIWSNWIDYTEVIKDNSLFVSEFGFQAPANSETWASVISKHNLQSDNPIFEFHNKQVEGQKRIFQFISNQLPVSNEWNDFIYLAQLNQGLALKSCIEHWISNRPTTNGAIVWQLNDCWPAVSWSIVDSEIQPKMAYYFVKRVFSPITLEISKIGSSISLNFINHSGRSFVGILKISLIDQRSGTVIKEIESKVDINRIGECSFQTSFEKELSYNNFLIVVASLYNDNRNLVYRNFYLNQEWKKVKLRREKFEFDITREKNFYITVKSDTPAFFVDLYLPGINFNDRGFILLPDETRKLKVIGELDNNLRSIDLMAYSLNKYLS